MGGPEHYVGRFYLFRKVEAFLVGSSRVTRTSAKFGHTLTNSGNPDETAPYEPSHQDFHCLLTLSIFLFQLLKYETNKVAVQIYLVYEVTRLYPIRVKPSGPFSTKWYMENDNG